MLEDYNLEVKIKAHKINEVKEKQKGNPKEIVSRIAKKKALSVSSNYSKEYVIGSDQILVKDKKIYSKSKNIEEALSLFRVIVGQKYKLISATCVVRNNKLIWKQIKEAKLYMKKIKEVDIKNYLTRNKKTVTTILGSYEIEKDELNCIKIIKGDMETIMGFPIKDFIKLKLV